MRHNPEANFVKHDRPSRRDAESMNRNSRLLNEERTTKVVKPHRDYNTFERGIDPMINNPYLVNRYIGNHKR